MKPPTTTMLIASTSIQLTAVPAGGRIRGAPVTSVFSVGSPHVPLAGRLLASPSYEAIHRYVPVPAGVNAADSAVPPVNTTTLVNTGALAHVASAGPNSRNVTICGAVGFASPVRVT